MKHHELAKIQEFLLYSLDVIKKKRDKYIFAYLAEYFTATKNYNLPNTMVVNARTCCMSHIKAEYLY